MSQQQPPPELPSDPATQQLINERNSLRSQNDQLWKIVEKQRGIIQNLQKDLAKVSAERDLFRQAHHDLPTPAQTPSDHHQHHDQYSSPPPNTNGYQHHHHGDQRRPHDADPNPELPLNGDREPELASGSDHHHHHHSNRHQHPEHQSSRHHGHSHRPNPLNLAQASAYEGDLDASKQDMSHEGSASNANGFDQQHQQHQRQHQHPYQHHLSPSYAPPPEGDTRDFDAEVQATTRGRRPQQQQQQQHHQGSLNNHAEREPRTMENNNGNGYPPNPSTPRNISGSIAIAPHLMPHVPPRSPRRERKDEQNNSPHASDNEDDLNQPQQGSRRNGGGGGSSGAMLTPPRARGDYAAPEPSPGLYSTYPNQDTRGDDTEQSASYPAPAPGSPATTKVTFLGLPTSSGRKAAPGLGPTNLAPNALTPLDVGPSSPTTTPTSPVHAIIDQDAEKFRMYMNKNIAPSSNRKVPPAARSPGFDNPDHAAHAGQAAAMENIQAQIDLSSQDGHPHPHDPSANSEAISNPESHYRPQESWMNQPSSQVPLPPEIRDRKRQSSLPIIEGYPKIGARSTSHQRAGDGDGYSDDYPLPQPPRRYDSQPTMDQPGPGITRCASPTLSANSSVTLVPGGPQPGYTRTSPTVHQQAFHMFGDSLEAVSIMVLGSNIKVNDKGRELLMFIVSVGREVQDNTGGPAPHRESDELWRVEKQYIDFVNLDSKLRITQSRNVVNNLPKLPDKSLFSTNAPSKSDARKLALEQYLQQLLSIRIKDTRDVCEFLRMGIVERGSYKEGKEAGWKEGYLTKRGKNFGGWKTRFFVLRGPVLEYFDTKDGHHLGSIALTYAQIGRQQAQEKQDGDNSHDPNSYRHAFLILEPKKGQTVADAKRNPNSVMRHVLCAESDEDRDEWVEALLVHVGKESMEQQTTPTTAPVAVAADPIPIEKEKERTTTTTGTGRRMPEIQKVSATPIKDLASVKGNEKLLLNQEAYERQQRSIPGSPSHTAQQFNTSRGAQSPTLAGMNLEDRHSQERQSAEGQHANGRNNNQYNDQEQQQQQQGQAQRNQSSHSLNQPPEETAPPPGPYLTPAEVAEKKQRSRMTFHWPKKSTKEESPIQLPGQGAQQPASKDSSGTAPTTQSSGGGGLRTLLGGGGKTSNTNNAPAAAAAGHNQGGNGAGSTIRQVFGVTLEQAIEQAIVQPGYQLPAVVYRCIEYLNAHNAKLEEGIYRLSGSSAVMKNLKDRFNQEGDVPLLASEEYYDVHAIAGLLKLFLRDLPSSVLTRELHKEFLQVIELANRSDRVGELTRLVATLPEANYTLLRALTAHLIEIVENADVNKMTARNVGIVFSPTLGIPAGVFALLMSDFDQIFHTNDGRIMPLENNMQRTLNDPNAILEA